MPMIDLDETLKELESRELICRPFEANGEARVSIIVFKMFLKSRPVVDAVPVVRCKDCKHSLISGWSSKDGTLYSCNRINRRVHLDDYCSYGERRSEQHK